MPDLTHFLWGRLFDQGPAMGLILNLGLSAAALLVGALLGVPLGAFRAMAPPLLQAPLAFLLGIVRGTPLLLLVLWVYLLVQVVAAIPLAPLWIGCIALAAYATTHVSDIVRAGARAVPAPQLRSAHALGLSNLQIARSVLVPVSLRVMVPALTTFASSLFKDSSVCYVIGVVDLVQLALLETTRNARFLLEYYSLMAALFLAVNLVGTRICARLERRLRIPGALSSSEEERRPGASAGAATAVPPPPRPVASSGAYGGSL